MSTVTSRIGPHRPGRLWTRVVALVLVWCCAVPLLIPTPGAAADEVGDLQERADRIAQSLMDLQQQLGELGEKYNQSQVRRARLAEEKAALERRARAAESTLAARRSDAARYALSAYAGLGQDDTLSMALDGRQWELSRRDGYAAIRIGDREQLVDDLQAAQQVNDDLLASLDTATRAEKQAAADLEKQQQQATELMARQQRLQASVKGELAQAVAQRQAALAEQRAARAAREAPPTSERTGADEGPASSVTDTAGRPAPTVPGSSGSVTPPSNPTTRPSPSPTRPPATSPPITSPPPPVSPPPAGSRGQRAAQAAISQLGVPYSWGGGTPSGPSYGFGPGAGIRGFDCSGLTLYAWAQSGVSLYHSAQMQYNRSSRVSLSQLQPGDLVFYGSSSGSISHVSIYVGGGRVVHAPNHTTVVQYGAVHLWSGYYPWIGAGRPG